VTIERIVVGVVATNCYVIGDEEERVGAVVDPGDEPEKILKLADRMNVDIAYVINTHGHVDHIGANRIIKERTNAPLMIHCADADMLHSPSRNLSLLMGREIVSPQADRLLEEGDTIMFGGVRLEVVHTPGHSPGSVCLFGDGFVFSGDTLFFDSIGRTDFPGSSYEDIMSSIRDVLSPLPDTLTVYPGHGPYGQMGEIRMVNPFLA
jgi:glyoxylase-like metal-dependent hydrolase (beta-lactamase superfamily II)